LQQILFLPFQVQDEEIHVNYLTQNTPKIPSNKDSIVCHRPSTSQI